MSNTLNDVSMVRCRWCGLTHFGACHKVKAFDYHPDGTVKRVEFHPPPDAQSVKINQYSIWERVFGRKA